MSSCGTDATELKGDGAEKSSNPFKPDCDKSGMKDVGTIAGTIAVAVAVGAVFGFIAGLPAAVVATATAGATFLGLTSKAMAESSLKRAAIKARIDVMEHAMKKQLEMQKERNRHELAMIKNKGLRCSFEDCDAFFDDGVALTKHFQACHTGVKCSVEGCEALLSDRSALDQHTQMCHSGSQFACPSMGCKLIFSNTNDFCTHVSEVHALNLKS